MCIVHSFQHHSIDEVSLNVWCNGRFEEFTRNATGELHDLLGALDKILIEDSDHALGFALENIGNRQ